MWLFARLPISKLRLTFGLLFVFLSVQTAANPLCTLPPDTIRIEKEIIVYDTIYTYDYIYDTVYVFDTIFVDILNRIPTSSLLNFSFNSRSLEGIFRVNDTISHHKIKGSALFAEIASSAFIFQNFYSFPAAAGAGFRRDFKVSLNPKPGFSLDARLGYMKSDRWMLKAGIAWSVFYEDFSYQSMQKFSDTSFIYTDQSYFSTTTDTITIYQADALLNGDSSIFVDYIYSYQQWVQQFDTAMQVKDSLSVQNQQDKNKWTYLEIPLLGAYRMYLGAVEIDLEGGLIPGFLISSSRTLLFDEPNGLVGRILSREQTTRFMLNAQLGASFSYPINKHWRLLMNPWIKLPVFSPGRQGMVNALNSSEGLRIGIRYQF